MSEYPIPEQPNKQKNSGDANNQGIMPRIVSIEERFEGPLPHPAILEKYNQIIPGAADRILKMAEDQSQHRRRLEQKVIGSDALKSILGVFFAFIIAFSGLAIGGYTALQGQPFFGGTVSIAVIGSVVWTFIYGTQQKKRNKGT